MPLDASIPLRAIAQQTVQQYDPMESLGKMLSLRSAEAQFADAERKRNDEMALNDLYRSSTGQNGRVDNAALLQGMAQRGLGSHIPGMQKQIAESDRMSAQTDKLRGEIDATDLKTKRDRLGAVNDTLASLLGNPNLTHDDVIRSLVPLAQQGIISDQNAQQFLRQMPGRQDQLRPFLMQKALEGMDASKRIEAILPKVQMVNLGGTEQAVDMNPMTNPSLAGRSFQKTATPDSVLQANTSRANNAATNAVTMRGQNMADARQRESNAQGKIPPGYRQLPDGTLQAIAGGPADPAVKRDRSSQQVLGLIDQANGLLDGATGSYLGAGADAVAQAFGKSTKGAQNAAQLKALEGAIMMAQPRMEGPQSDKDVAIYRQMAGQIGDSTVPVATRKAALETIKQLHSQYSGSGGQSPKPAAVASPAGAPRVGAVQDGYLYSGGDPASPASWKKVQ